MKNIHIHKILIIRLSSIGDIVLTTAFARVVRKSFPNAKIDFMTYKQYAQILEFNPNINEIIRINKNYDKIKLEEIKNKINSSQGIYDVIFDLHNNSKSNLLSSNLSNNIYKIDKRRLFKLGLVWFKIGKNSPYKTIHQIYMQTMSDFDIINDNYGLEFWMENDKKDNIYRPHLRKNIHLELLKVVVAPGAYYKTKKWGNENYAELIKKIAPYCEKITIIGGKNDAIDGEIITSKNPNVINLCGKLDLLGSCREIDNSDLVITNDTGVMHIAAARNVPVVVFFGSTVREFGFEPFRVQNLIIEEDLLCRPCSHIGRNFCPLIHFKCMKNIQPQTAYDRISEFVKNIYFK